LLIICDLLGFPMLTFNLLSAKIYLRLLITPLVSFVGIITLLPFFIKMLQYDWLWIGHMIIKEMFHIPIKLKPELARISMTTSHRKTQQVTDNKQWLIQVYKSIQINNYIWMKIKNNCLLYIAKISNYVSAI
jgi:hypothetical protein